MEKSKLIKILHTLSDSEIKEFGKFLEGNSFRKTGSAYKLFLYLRKLHPILPINKIKKEYVQKKLFKDLESSEKHLFNIMSQLTTALEDFLVKKLLEEEAIDKDFLLLKAYKKRKLDKFFFQKIGAIEKKWDQSKAAGIEQLHDKYRLKKICFLHPNYSLLSESESSLDIPDLIELLDQYYFTIKLYWVSCHLISSHVLNKEDKGEINNFIEEISQLSEKSSFKSVPQIQLLSKLSNAILSKDFENYEELKTMFVNCLNLFDKCEKLDLINLLTYYCLQNYKVDSETALKDIFELNSFSVEQELVLEDGYITAEMFRNMVNVGCSVNELEWTEHFINEYKDKIKEGEREDMTALCESILAMNKGGFDIALQKLIQIKMQNSFYGLQTRAIQLKCYYELEGYEDLFDNLIISFTKFIDRNQQLSNPMKESVKNFIYFTKIVKKERYKNAQISKDLIDRLNKENRVSWKRWLLKKVEEVGYDS